MPRIDLPDYMDMNTPHDSKHTTTQRPARGFGEPADMPLMDVVHSMTFARKLMGHTINPGSAAQRVMANTRAALKRANRFVLDDDAVRLVCHLSHERERLAAWSFLARIPYDTFWVEHNLHAKVKEFADMGSIPGGFIPHEVAPRFGMLFQKDREPGAARWVCQTFIEWNEAPGALPGLLAFVFDPEGDVMVPVRGSALWRLPTLSLIPNFPTLEFTYSNGAPSQTGDPEFLLYGLWETDEEGHTTVPSWWLNRSATTIDPLWNILYPPVYQDHGVIDHMQTYAAESRELMGVMRWIITMLAAINALPRDVKPIAARTGKRAAGMTMLPYFQHHNLTIRLPKDNRVVWARKELEHAYGRNSQRPWHEVMGHWRVVDRGKSTRMCRHVPVMVEHGLGICERCELLVRWINAHERGDPAIGIVRHTYNVTTR